MNCVTMKEGTYCSFMTAAGCGYNGGRCHVVVDSCKGCERVVNYPTGEFCSSFPNPMIKWEFGKCNFATHIRVERKEEKKLNPLKASKRSAGK